MCVLDIILSLCLIIALVQGLLKGFTEQIIALVSIIAGTWIAFKFSKLVCNLIQPYLNASEKFLYVLVFILMVALVICLFHLLGWLDRLLGAIFSTIKAALIIGIVIILFSTLNSTFHVVEQKYLDESVLYTPLKNIAYDIFPYLKQLLFK